MNGSGAAAPLRAVLAGVIGFGGGMAGLGLSLSLGLVLAVRRGTYDLKGDLLIAALYVLVPAALSTAGFAVATSLSRAWRGQPARRAALVGGCLGLAACVASFTGLLFAVPLLASVLRDRPAAGAACLFVSSGILCGLAAVGVACLSPADPRR